MAFARFKMAHIHVNVAKDMAATSAKILLVLIINVFMGPCVK